MGILYVVATPIGNLDDITKRALDILNSVDLIACEDTRTSGVLLKHFGINKKTVSYHKFNEKGKSNSLINDLLNGKNIALISDAGCPCISDPGSILVHEAILNNIEVIAIPGASATITSLMCSGMDTASFSFYGFLDRENKKIVNELEIIKVKFNELNDNFKRHVNYIKEIQNNYPSLQRNDNEEKVVISQSDMVNEEMKQDAINIAIRAGELNNEVGGMAYFIKNEFDNKYGTAWECVVGYDYGASVTHDQESYINFFIGKYKVLLFKVSK
jgi:16S rRNA C1402 (ribose-2'-O) methylase RsmI